MPRPKVETKESVPCIPSGSVLLDLVLGGGWAEGRVANIVGDRSAGKTLLAIEACANFALKYKAEDIAYREAEAAFDLDYARTMGLPRDIQYSEEVRTVEDFERDLDRWLDNHPNPNMYILDSLDAISSEAEMDRAVGESSYGDGKAKALSQLFRKLTGKLAKSKCTLIIISQIRDNIGVRFGETKKRSGGHALNFYASQIVWLHEVKKIKQTVTKVERITGVEVLAKNKKNKIGKPFREAQFCILFGYGVDDERSMISWLKANYEESSVTMAEINQARREKDYPGHLQLSRELKADVVARWREIEDALAPQMSKYQ